MVKNNGISEIEKQIEMFKNIRADGIECIYKGYAPEKGCGTRKYLKIYKFRTYKFVYEYSDTPNYTTSGYSFNDADESIKYFKRDAENYQQDDSHYFRTEKLDSHRILNMENPIFDLGDDNPIGIRYSKYHFLKAKLEKLESELA